MIQQLIVVDLVRASAYVPPCLTPWYILNLSENRALHLTIVSASL